jgi:hypothetical protein
MPPVKIRLAAACALLVLAATGCGSNGEPSSAESSSPSASGSTRATASGPLAKQLQALQDRAQQDSRFSEVTRRPTGEEISSIRGRYSLDDEQVAATFRVPNPSSGKNATARLAIVGKDAFLQVDQWKEPSRGCWLKSTSQELSQRFALDVADSDEVPLPVGLLDAFVPESSQGKGLIQGHLDIAEALPLLSGSLKSQLVQARPSGTVAAFLTYDPRHMLITVPGYALSSALSNSLKVDEQKLSSIAGARYEAGVTTLSGAFDQVAAPQPAKQMSTADLEANRCG